MRIILKISPGRGATHGDREPCEALDAELACLFARTYLVATARARRTVRRPRRDAAEGLSAALDSEMAAMTARMLYRLRARERLGGRGRQLGTRLSRGASGTRCAPLRRRAARDVCAPREEPNRTNEREERNALSRAVVCSPPSRLARTAAEPRGVGRLLFEPDLLVTTLAVSVKRQISKNFCEKIYGRCHEAAARGAQTSRLTPEKLARTNFSRQNTTEFKKHRPTHKRTRRRSPSSTRATLPSRLFPTAQYRPQPPARSPASHRPARNAPRRLAAHENANRRDVCRARCRLHVGLGRTSRGRAAARGRAMRPRVERAPEHCRDCGRLDPNRYAPRGRRGYASFPTDAAASSNISSDASESE